MITPLPTRSPLTGPAPEVDLRELARDFQSIFINEMLKAMRQTAPQPDIFGGGDAEDTMQVMLDQELATVLSRRIDGSLVSAIERQLRGLAGKDAP